MSENELAKQEGRQETFCVWDEKWLHNWIAHWIIEWTINSPICSFRSSNYTKLKVATEVWIIKYRKISNIRRTLVGNTIVDHSDVVGASPVGAAPTTSSFSTWHLASRDSAKTAARQYDNLLSVGI